jgi:DNA-directed RNA polymerase subunit RPC12/RpoP
MNYQLLEYSCPECGMLLKEIAGVLNQDLKESVEECPKCGSGSESVNPVLNRINRSPSSGQNQSSTHAKAVDIIDQEINDIQSNNNNNNNNSNNNNSNNNTDTDQSVSNYDKPPLTSDLTIVPTITNQIKLYSNSPYTPSKSDASDASDALTITATTQPIPKAQSKAEQVGLPELPCIYCEYSDCIEFDLSLHYIEKHRQNLVRLPIGKSSIDDRADYAVKLSKKKLSESYDDSDYEDEDYEHENEGVQYEESDVSK